MTHKYKNINYTTTQLFWLVALRVLIGWHFLYEGLVKVVNPNWSSAGYLMDSQGFFSGFPFAGRLPRTGMVLQVCPGEDPP